MFGTNKQSILHRPVKKVTNFNRENQDVEFERQQQLLQAKRNKFNALVDHRRRAINGNYEEKRELQDSRRQEIEEHLNYKKEIEEHEKQVVKQLEKKQDEHVFLQFGKESQERDKKREYLKSIMEENKKMMEYKEQAKRNEREMDKQIETKSDFFDRYRSYR